MVKNAILSLFGTKPILLTNDLFSKQSMIKLAKGPSSKNHRIWYVKAFMNYEGTKVGYTDARAHSYLSFSA